MEVSHNVVCFEDERLLSGVTKESVTLLDKAIETDKQRAKAVSFDVVFVSVWKTLEFAYDCKGAGLIVRRLHSVDEKEVVSSVVVRTNIEVLNFNSRKK